MMETTSLKSLSPIELLPKTLEIQKEKIEYCENQIKKEMYLWDMRCWDKHKDREEILRWLDNNCVPNNCGHTVLCIQELLKKGVSKDRIVELMLPNPHIQFKNRLAKCFENPNLCPVYSEVQNYGDCNCEVCE